ncbi:phosphatase 2C-like domain-containing protein [Cubamyces lactineus]|nr:phosphatase 2C-like domain-containing protein [Cubamyces lactineus]
MANAQLDAARRHLANAKICQAAEVRHKRGVHVHSVSFQPLGQERHNQDHMVTKKWVIGGQRWLFLALCDGNHGHLTADYVVETLPERVKQRLETLIKESLGGFLDCVNVEEADPAVKSMLEAVVLELDEELANAIRDICPSPQDLTEDDARSLVNEHRQVIKRAVQGTTLAMALIAPDDRFMWALGVGNSTIAISTTDDTGKRHAERLLNAHSFEDPREHVRFSLHHPSAESQKGLIHNKRLFGRLLASRTIGNHHLKMDKAYAHYLFQYVDMGKKKLFPSNLDKTVLSPPYLTAEPSIRFVDLKPMWDQDLYVLLFSDGVDSIVDGSCLGQPTTGARSGADPVNVVSALLSYFADPDVERILGHHVQPRWNGPRGNVALDVLGNLLGGMDAAKLEKATKRPVVRSAGDHRLDDTTIVVARFARHRSPGAFIGVAQAANAPQS